MLKHSCVHHRDRSHDETSSHLQDWAKVDLVLAKQWVDHDLLIRQSIGFIDHSLNLGLTIKKRNEDDQSDWVEVLQQIVWSAVQCHGSCL